MKSIKILTFKKYFSSFATSQIEGWNFGNSIVEPLFVANRNLNGQTNLNMFQNDSILAINDIVQETNILHFNKSVLHLTTLGKFLISFSFFGRDQFIIVQISYTQGLYTGSWRSKNGAIKRPALIIKFCYLVYRFCRMLRIMLRIPFFNNILIFQVGSSFIPSDNLVHNQPTLILPMYQVW